MNGRFVQRSVVTFVFVVALVATYLLLDRYIGSKKLARTISGDVAEISFVEISFAGEKIRLSKTSEVNYFKEKLSASEKCNQEWFLIGEMKIGFKGFGSWKGDCFLSANSIAVKTPPTKPIEPGWPTHEFKLGTPPLILNELLEQHMEDD